MALAQHAPDRIDELKPKEPQPSRPADEKSWF